jgi:hypothetical protein
MDEGMDGFAGRRTMARRSCTRNPAAVAREKKCPKVKRRNQGAAARASSLQLVGKQEPEVTLGEGAE